LRKRNHLALRLLNNGGGDDDEGPKRSRHEFQLDRSDPLFRQTADARSANASAVALKSRIYFDVSSSHAAAATADYCVFGTQESSQDLELKINGRLITRVQNCKYLFTYVDSSLSWKYHIEYVHKKLVKFTGISYKLRSKLNHNFF